MKYFFEAVLFAVFVAALANASVKPVKGNSDGQKSQCNVNNYFYAGPNTKKIEQQLAEIKELIRVLQRNQTGGSTGKVHRNCAELYKSGSKTVSGVYKINPDGLGEFEVFCDQKTAGGGWTVFQRRRDGSVDFYRGWGEYKQGFGNLNGEFWLGLDKIHRLTVRGKNKLRVDLEDLHGSTAFAQYSLFAVTSERAKYQLSLGSYSGTAGDSLGYHRGYPFSTKDRDNDKYGHGSCAAGHRGAWWYKTCCSSNLNGLYLHGQLDWRGVVWHSWKKNTYSVKRSEMKIRPKAF